MVFIFFGQDKTEVEIKINDVLENMEKQKRFDHIIDIRKLPDGWKGTLVLFFHNH
jgi:hypothetical protein